MTDGPGSSVLTVKGLSKRFGGLVAVDSLDLAVAQGEVHGLIGPNGSGKSTTLNLISGLYTPTRGQIILGDRDVTAESAARRNWLGLARTFQNTRLFKRLTVLENVMVGGTSRSRAGLVGVLLRTRAMRAEEVELRRTALETLDLVGLAGHAHRLPGELPYGQQRLVEVARALAGKPRLLLLDEPAAGMNPREKEELLGLVQRLNQQLGLPILLVEHDMDLVMNACHRVSVLNFGAQIAVGTPDQIREDPAVIAAYLGKGDAPSADG